MRVKEPGEIRNNAAIGVKAIGAAVERKAGIMSAHFARKRCKFMPGDLGRVANDEV